MKIKAAKKAFNDGYDTTIRFLKIILPSSKSYSRHVIFNLINVL